MRPDLKVVASNTLNDVARYGLAYLATPYSKYNGGIELAHKDAAKLAARLVRAGLKLFCPITHTHSIATLGGIDPLDHDIWMPFDRPMMDVCKTLLIGKLGGWDYSDGINKEIKVFAGAGKPIFYLDPDTLGVTRRANESC